jgi:hypothetical protein
VEEVEPLVLVVVPTGLGGEKSFLDAGDPTAYVVGNVVTGRFSLYDADGEELRMEYVHVYVYSVDGSGLRDKLTLLTHEVFHFDRETGEYIFSWDTTGQASGEYVIRLSFGDDAGTTYDLRIRVG